MLFLKANILTIVTFMPIFGALLMVLYDKIVGRNDETLRIMALFFTVLTFLLSLPLISWYTEPMLTVNKPWIESLGVNYHLQVDGLSLWLVILTTVLMPIALLSGWTAIHKHVREYLIFMLALETG